MSALPAFVSIGDVAFFAGGFAVCWFFKDSITKLFVGAENWVKALEAKLAKAKAAL